MKKILKNYKIGYPLFFILGAVIFGSIGVTVATSLSASNIKYTPPGGEETTLQLAIEDLYRLANSTESCPDGLVCYPNAPTVTTKNLPVGVKAIVYLNPTNLSAICNEDLSVSTTGTKIGCMKWYAYAETDTTYTMILDHNTTDKVPYNTSNSNVSMGTTSGNVGYDLAQLTSTSHWVVTPRLIEANEIAEIVGNTSWDSTNSSANKFYFGSLGSKDYSSQTEEQKARQRSYAWLFDYAGSCTSSGCNHPDSLTYGYWTSTPKAGSSNSVWVVGSGGILNYTSAYITSNGLRPVITVNKSDISIN